MSNTATSGHKFVVGQSVSFSPSRWSMRGGDSSCKILRQMPLDGGEFHYRIKCATEPFERMVKESELAAAPRS